jgi:PAS domain S-box-containing protein
MAHADLPPVRLVRYLRPLYRWPTLGPRATITIAIALFAGVFVMRISDPNVGDAVGALYVVPTAVLALRFGLRGGLAGCLAGIALVVTWDLTGHPSTMTAAGYLSRGISYLLIGTLLGVFVDHRRRLEAEIARNYDASLDLLATADLAGRFTHVNPAWESALGHTAELMCSRPFIDFVHPEDRAATIAETAVLVDGSRDTVGFCNRYRTADGNYRWLQWSACMSQSERVIHAVARDITAQREAEQQLLDNAKLLETKVGERTRELEEARGETLQLLALAAEYRDDETSQHTERVGVAAAEIATRLGLDTGQIRLLREAAPLHDVGKLAISDRILLTPGKLSAHDYGLMKTHAELGAGLLARGSSPVLKMAAVIAASHHERWDGTGYPAGLAGEAIPLVGRVVAVADVFDALTHRRPYKSAWPVEQAIAEIKRAAGTQFDPRVVAAFLTTQKTAETTTEARGPRRLTGVTTASGRSLTYAGSGPRPRSARYV